MELNPVPVLISIVIFSNIGGTCTPVGDPPNVIISNNPDVIKHNIDFATFTTHMLLGILPVIVVAYFQLRITFRSMKSLQFSEPYAVAGNVLNSSSIAIEYSDIFIQNFVEKLKFGAELRIRYLPIPRMRTM